MTALFFKPRPCTTRSTVNDTGRATCIGFHASVEKIEGLAKEAAGVFTVEVAIRLKELQECRY